MIQFLKENALWLSPIVVAIIGGLFSLIKKSKGKINKQTIKNVNNSSITINNNQ